jgi:hypothetical protein
MPAAQRVKGQEVSIAITVDGALQTQIDTIQNAEIEFEQELLEEGYLGETSDRVDSVFKLIRINITGHINSAAYIELADAIVARSRNRAGGVVRIDVIGSFAFPNGDLPSIVIPDVYFENLPLNIGSRSEFVEFTLSGKASDYTIV